MLVERDLHFLPDIHAHKHGNTDIHSFSVADSDQYGYYATNLYTGEQLWYKNGTDNGLNNPVTIGNIGNSPIGPGLTQQYLRLTLGQLYNYYSVNGAGVLS